MQYSVDQLLRENEIMSHIFLECTPQDVLEKVAARKGELNIKMVNIELLVEGESIDPKKFFDQFFTQYAEMVRKDATEIIKEQLSNKFEDMQSKMREMEEITSYWAEEINWQVDNPLIKKDNEV